MNIIVHHINGRKSVNKNMSTLYAIKKLSIDICYLILIICFVRLVTTYVEASSLKPDGRNINKNVSLDSSKSKIEIVNSDSDRPNLIESNRLIDYNGPRVEQPSQQQRGQQQPHHYRHQQHSPSKLTIKEHHLHQIGDTKEKEEEEMPAQRDKSLSPAPSPSAAPSSSSPPSIQNNIESHSEVPTRQPTSSPEVKQAKSATSAKHSIATMDVDSFVPHGYDKLMPPKENGNPTVVRFHVWVLGLDSVDEGSMTYVADIFMSQSWKDYRLIIPHNITFNVNTSADPRGPYRLLPVTLIDKIWRPDSFFKNAKEVTFQEMTIPNHYIWLYSDHTILYMVKLSLLLSCAMKFQTYPHDTQNCTMKIESLSYTTKDLVFDWEESDPLVVEDNIELPQHDLIEKKIDYCTTTYSSGTFACVQVLFTIKRRLGYYIFHTYIPTCLIVIMSWISFWIKPEAVPARVTLCVTSLLTLSTQHAQSQKNLPPVSYIKAIDIFMSSCTVFVFASLMEYALVNILMSDELLNGTGGWMGLLSESSRDYPESEHSASRTSVDVDQPSMGHQPNVTNDGENISHFYASTQPTVISMGHLACDKTRTGQILLHNNHEHDNEENVVADGDEEIKLDDDRVPAEHVSETKDETTMEPIPLRHNSSIIKRTMTKQISKDSTIMRTNLNHANESTIGHRTAKHQCLKHIGVRQMSKDQFESDNDQVVEQTRKNGIGECNERFAKNRRLPRSWSLLRILPSNQSPRQPKNVTNQCARHPRQTNHPSSRHPLTAIGSNSTPPKTSHFTQSSSNVPPLKPSCRKAFVCPNSGAFSEQQFGPTFTMQAQTGAINSPGAYQQQKHQRAYLVDKVSRIIFPLSFIVLNMVYWAYFLELVPGFSANQT